MAVAPPAEHTEGLLLPGVCPGDHEKATSGEGDGWS